MNLLQNLEVLKSLRNDEIEEDDVEKTICVIRLEREIIHQLFDIGFSDKEITKIINNAQIKI